MFTNDMKQRIRFFHAYGGSIVGEQMLCAAALARAEQWREDVVGICVEWKYSECPDLSWGPDCYGIGTWQHLLETDSIYFADASLEWAGQSACLWEIAFLCRNADDRLRADRYRRVVEAELALELMPAPHYFSATEHALTSASL